MKDYKETDVLKALKKMETINGKSTTGREYFSQYSAYTDYIVTENRLYSRDEISNLPEEERNIILDKGLCVNEHYIHQVMGNQNIIDNEETNLSFVQKEFLRTFLAGENYFIPYTLDGEWDYADRFKVIEKVALVKALLQGAWRFDISWTTLGDVVYMAVIYLDDEETKSKILDPYRRSKKHNIKSNIELYIPYSQVLQIYKKKLFVSTVWDYLILKEDE